MISHFLCNDRNLISSVMRLNCIPGFHTFFVNNRNLSRTQASTSSIKVGEFVISTHSLVLADRTLSS